MSAPFLTFYTPTYRRPQGLAACLRSVSAQTARDRIEQIVIPDHVGHGIEGMYAAIPQYAAMVHGAYVHLLADDDVLAAPDVVERLEMAIGETLPPLVIVRALKGALTLPLGAVWPPVCGRIDLGCIITRADVWKRHCGSYGKRYEGDFDFVAALAAEGIQPLFLDLLFLMGAVSKAAPEPAPERMAVLA